MRLLAPLLLVAAVAPFAERKETAAAREEARRCLELARERAVEVCGRALALGLATSRAAVVRRALALELIALDRGTEAVEVYREAARAQPEDAETHLRLGQALLSIGGDAEAALPVLERARDLRPDEPRTHGALGLAASALGRAAEAVSSFEAALRLDPDYFASRPGARRAYEAALRGERWPVALTPSPPPP
ncbi:MAG TPA: tetratricopeptide repeat protein [Vicinamibacteria bacterium]|nr:tetratricopeptide repeat protein [Vicinamibacteria bacterium]